MMSEGIGESLPYACQDWTNTKAAYGFSPTPITRDEFKETVRELAKQSIPIIVDECLRMFDKRR